MMKIYIDENLSPHIAKGLDILEKPLGEGFEVLSIGEIFGRGAKDEDWLPQIGQENGVVITQDLNIQRSRQQRELYKKHNIGVFFLSAPSRNGFSYWEMVAHIVNRWQDIKKKSRKSLRPFAYRCTTKKDFEEI